MKRNTKPTINIFVILILIFFSSQKIFAATFYVGQSGSPGGNYFTNIQSAVNASSPEDYVIISNGTYLLNSPIDVNTNLTIKSASGQENTIIDGNNTNICFVLYNHSTIIEGFTITNGNGKFGVGGGVYCEDRTPIITNCLITGNSNAGFGGGGVYGGTINNCVIRNNSGGSLGGGVCESTVNNSMISDNSTDQSGGGAYNSTINNCTITGNSSTDYGGGVSDCIVNNSTISGNTSDNGGGNNGGTVNNCIIVSNWANKGGASFDGTNKNCVIIGNTANQGGGLYENVTYNCTITDNSGIVNAGGTYNSVVNNSIVYYNTALTDDNRFGGVYSYCCTATNAAQGTGNITNLPILLSASHIATNSPCIGAGNNSYTSGFDIDGEAWKNPPSIGCDEIYINAISGSLSVAIIGSRFTYENVPINFTAEIEGQLYENIWSFGDGTAETNKYKNLTCVGGNRELQCNTYGFQRNVSGRYIHNDYSFCY